MVDVDIDEVAAADPGPETDTQPSKLRMVVRNPRPRKIIDWLQRQLPHVEQLKLSGCKRCGPVICGFVPKLFEECCAISRLPVSRPTPSSPTTSTAALGTILASLRSGSRRQPQQWQRKLSPALPLLPQQHLHQLALVSRRSLRPARAIFKCMVNNVLFACLAAVIWNNLKEAALRVCSRAAVVKWAACGCHCVLEPRGSAAAAVLAWCLQAPHVVGPWTGSRCLQGRASRGPCQGHGA